jgi:hypothetical protein
MYQLKKVYGVISFEDAKIKLVVLEKNVQRTNCLYYDECKIIYTDNEFNLINVEALKEALNNLVRNADAFIGRSLKRYVINIPCLPTISVCSQSPQFLVFKQYLDENKYQNLINKITCCGIKNDRTIINIHPQE